MRMQGYIVIALAVLCLPLIGCSEKYQYKGTWYTDPQKCLDAQKADQNKLLDKITPLVTPLVGKGLVLVPDDSILWSQITGPKTQLSQKGKEMLLRSLDMSYALMGESVQKRGIFESAEIQRSDAPERLPTGDYDAVIYLFSGQWFLRTKADSEAVPIYFDLSKEDAFERIVSWLDNIEKVLSKEQMATK